MCHVLCYCHSNPNIPSSLLPHPSSSHPPLAFPSLSLSLCPSLSIQFFTSPKMRGAMFPFDQISAPMSSHCQKNTEMHKIFPSLPESEKLIAGVSPCCALLCHFVPFLTNCSHSSLGRGSVYKSSYLLTCCWNHLCKSWTLSHAIYLH